MIRHDLQLWAYASKELELGEHRYVESHLDDCPECVEHLAAVQVAKEALELARSSSPRVEWTRVDQRIGALVERRLAAKARGPWLGRLGLGGLGLAAVAAGLALFVSLPSSPVAPTEPVVPPPGLPVASWARVDHAEGLTKLGAGDGELRDGAELRAGDVLRTSLAGRAFVHLPDASHVRVGGGAQLTMTRTEADDVALTLERGRVAVRASHAERRGFVVHSGGVSVHVVGTVFGVERDADGVEVAVSEGQVRVELASGDSIAVSPGERLRIDGRTERARRLKLTPSLQRELAEVADLARTTASVEQRAVVAASGGGPSSPPMVNAQGTPRSLPRLLKTEARSRQATAPAGLDPGELAVLPAATPAPAQPEKPSIVLEAPEDVWPSLGGGEIVRGVPARREPPPVSQPEEWASGPVPDADEWAPAPVKAAAVPAPSLAVAPAPVAAPAPLPAVAPAPAAVPASPSVVAPAPAELDGPVHGAALAEAAPAAAPARVAPKDLEQLFLQRAETAVEQGACERFLLGLEDLAQDAQRGARSEQARVLRARCFDQQLRPRQAMNEYRKYLEEYPSGRHVAEARRALGE